MNVCMKQTSKTLKCKLPDGLSGYKHTTLNVPLNHGHNFEYLKRVQPLHDWKTLTKTLRLNVQCQELFLWRFEKQNNLLERTVLFDKRWKTSSRSFESSSVGFQGKYCVYDYRYMCFLLPILICYYHYSLARSNHTDYQHPHTKLILKKDLVLDMELQWHRAAVYWVCQLVKWFHSEYNRQMELHSAR